MVTKLRAHIRVIVTLLQRLTPVVLTNIFADGLAASLGVPTAHISRIIARDIPATDKSRTVPSGRLLESNSSYFDVEFDVIVPEGVSKAVMSARVASLASGVETTATAVSFEKSVKARGMRVQRWEAAPPAASFLDEEIFNVSGKAPAFVTPKDQFITTIPTSTTLPSQNATLASRAGDGTTSSSMPLLVISCCLVLFVAIAFSCVVRWWCMEKAASVGRQDDSNNMPIV